MSQVLVVSLTELWANGYVQGITDSCSTFLPAFEKAFFVERDHAEKNPLFKQLIPYVVLTRGEGEYRQVFVYRRGSAQGESRLRGKLSLGVGGHIEPVDATSKDPYVAGMSRELSEEMDCIGLKVFERPSWLINDDTTEVGSVHLGLVHLAHVDTASPREAMPESQFLFVHKLMDRLDEFETWSQLVIRHVLGTEPMPPVVREADRLVEVARRQLQKWADRQGHNRCWYYPEIFKALSAALSVSASVSPELPSEEEFRRGCEEFIQEQYEE